ncbi:hypothetical protein CcarbDRAFT_1777 [Clostridium carboxidivorans P7]|uniref:Uncharacterized protein n=1 Tax=Clostridium carboxidivorans P7 TaxID=536227 RepID=C6PSL0_9CLOT|nr:hypothetical protein [Clostridium carboxidivorans]EET87784.1 hypothetical protein CcarbDRAFT_1777 [Clostridium carboxidivorans P7]
MLFSFVFSKKSFMQSEMGIPSANIIAILARVFSLGVVSDITISVKKTENENIIVKGNLLRLKYRPDKMFLTYSINFIISSPCYHNFD